MTCATNLKQKSILFVVSISLLVFLISCGVFKLFYLEINKRYVEGAVMELLEYVEHDYENVDEAIDWTAKALNLILYELKSVEELIMSFPHGVDPERVLSLSERQELEEGRHVIKDLEALALATDFEFNRLLFFYPIMKNGMLESLLFTFTPINGVSGRITGLSLLTGLLVMTAAGVTFFIGKKLFQKSYNQLQDIKQAATEVSKGNFDTKIWKNSEDEIGEISDVFNGMAIALKNDQERIKEFMEDISHEIKTPLTYIKTYNMALLDGTIQDPKEQRKSYHLIDRETTRLQKLIQNFLDFTKLDARAVELNKQPIVFAQCIEDIMIKYEPIFHKQKIQFNMTLDYDVIIEGDEDRMEQIIQNIVENAIRYSKENPSITLALEKQDDKCVLSISDNGVGISEEHLAVITNRFVRVNKVRSRKESGTGIGLSIVEKLVALHGGEMIIESELGVGTTFKLIFPCVEF